MDIASCQSACQAPRPSPGTSLQLIHSSKTYHYAPFKFRTAIVCTFNMVRYLWGRLTHCVTI